MRGDDYRDHDVISKLPDGSAPRVWGRCIRTTARQWARFGSAPRVWGRREHCRRARRARADRPTRVGTTPDGVELVDVGSGSAPRAWGRLCTDLLRARRSADQPHVRGDDMANYASMRTAATDQPHVRGDDL